MWALTTWWFLRSYERRSLGYAALAGLAAAAVHAEQILVGVSAGGAGARRADRRAPHALFRFAGAVDDGRCRLGAAGAASLLADAARLRAVLLCGRRARRQAVRRRRQSVLGYLAGSLGYVARAHHRGACCRAAGPRHARRHGLAEGHRAAGWRRRRSGRRSCCRWLAALGSGVEITSLWSMSAFTLLPVLLLSPPAVRLRAVDTARILMAAVALSDCHADRVALHRHRRPAQGSGAGVGAGGAAGGARRARLARSDAEAAALCRRQRRSRLWRCRLRRRPAASLPDLPQPSAAQLKKDGVVFVCFAEDQGCRSDVAAQATRIGHTASSSSR